MTTVQGFNGIGVLPLSLSDVDSYGQPQSETLGFNCFSNTVGYYAFAPYFFSGYAINWVTNYIPNAGSPEYQPISHLICGGNSVGIVFSAANSDLSVSDISGNYVNAIEVAGIQQNHHGVISDCEFNHSIYWPFLAVSSQQGEIMHGCQFRGNTYGGIFLDYCSGWDIYGCQFDNLVFTNANTPINAVTGVQSVNRFHDNTYNGWWATNVIFSTDGYLQYWGNTSYQVMGDNDGTAATLLLISNIFSAANLFGTLPQSVLPSTVITNNQKTPFTNDTNEVIGGSATISNLLYLPSPTTIDAGGSMLLYHDGNDNFFAGEPSGLTTVSGIQNTGYGDTTLSSITSGSANTALGDGALGNVTIGQGNTAIGQSAGNDFTNGTNNIDIGYEAGFARTAGSSNIDIGNPGVSSENNVIRIGNAQTDAYIAGQLHANGASWINSVATNILSSTNSIIYLPTSANGATPSQNVRFIGTNRWEGDYFCGITTSSTNSSVIFTNGYNPAGFTVGSGTNMQISIYETFATGHSDNSLVDCQTSGYRTMVVITNGVTQGIIGASNIIGTWYGTGGSVNNFARTVTCGTSGFSVSFSPTNSVSTFWASTFHVTETFQ